VSKSIHLTLLEKGMQGISKKESVPEVMSPRGLFFGDESAKRTSFWQDDLKSKIDAPAQEDILCEGELSKRRDLFSFLWSSKHYVLTKRNFLSYDVQRKDEIVAVTSTVHLGGFVIVEPPSKEVFRGFRISGTDGQSIELFTKDEESFLNWEKALRRVCFSWSFSNEFKASKVIGTTDSFKVVLSNLSADPRSYSLLIIRKL
jgi:hypothetical protein